MTLYVVAGDKPWVRTAWRECDVAHGWAFVSDMQSLVETAAEPDARYAFFLHWSSIVPPSVLDAVECVGFHMTDLPAGRGGSPLQHEVAAGKTHTTLTAFRMTDKLDAGPVYLKVGGIDITGPAEEVYLRVARVAMRMAQAIAAIEPEPVAQGETDEPVRRRRRPEDSVMPDYATLDQALRWTQMLDAAGYPAAFIERGSLRYELTRAQRRGDHVLADVRIREK